MDRHGDEGPYNKRIGRTFAVAAKAVTKEQFLRFLPEFSHYQMHRYPDPTCPIGGVTPELLHRCPHAVVRLPCLLRLLLLRLEDSHFPALWLGWYARQPNRGLPSSRSRLTTCRYSDEGMRRFPLVI